MMKKRWLQIGILTAVLVMVSVTAGLAQNMMPDTSLAAEQESAGAVDTITVQGTGTVSTNPDWSVIRLGVEQEAQTVEEAQAATAEAMEKIKQALLDNGVESENIRTADFHVRPDYRHFESGRELRAFVVRHILHVEYADIENVGRLLDAAARAGANRIDDVRFTVRDSSSLETEALEKAVDHARTKAEALAKASGKTIVNIHRIVESDARAGLPIYETAMFADSAKSATSLEVGPVEVKQNISVTFEVE